MTISDSGGMTWPEDDDDDLVARAADYDVVDDFSEVVEMGEETKDPNWVHSEYAPKKNVAFIEGIEASSRPTVWEWIQGGTKDMRCSLVNVHIHDILHALGLNPNSPWPPTADDFRDVFDMEEEL